MPTKKTEYVTSDESPKTAKRCTCGASVFQGPFQRGPIVDGMQVVRETLYQCTNCNRVASLGQFEDYPLEQ